MRIVHINSSDGVGGAGIAACRLHKGLLAVGVDSKMLVGQKIASDDRVDQVKILGGIGPRLIRKAANWTGLNDAGILGTAASVTNHPWVVDGDVLQFHNLHGGFFNYRAIAKITEFRPAVWTLHDMWAFTGHCVYSFDCERWKDRCGNCPDLVSYPAMRRDQTRLELSWKKKTYIKSRLVIVTLCNWMTKLVKDSVLSKFPVVQIPNGLDTTVFSQCNRVACRVSLGLPADSFVVLCASQSFSDTRKGGQIVINALNKLSEHTRKEITLLTFGSGGGEIARKTGLRCVDLGYLTSDRLKVIAFSSADLFVFPTIADNLPVIIQESMACSTPVLSCNVGGVPDMICHGVNGWLTDAGDSEGVREGIELLHGKRELLEKMSENARKYAVENYCLMRQANEYKNLYEAVRQGEL